ncbi:N-acetylmuramoyl-L-alanine amidase [bacterium]|nr:N-acetylmuramoyl-L-alanine amidase [bacterium]
MTRVVALTFLLLAVLFVPSYSTVYDPFKITTVVIDAGHGGKDPGTSSSGFREKDIALNIALKVGKYIEENHAGIKVLYTRRDDTFIELWERASIANRNYAHVFISVHVNANPSTSVYGTETYAMGTHVAAKNLDARKEEQEIVDNTIQRENEVILKEENYEENYDGYDPNDPASQIVFELFQSEYMEQSLLLAQKIQNQFETTVKRKNRGVKQAGFVVLYKTTMPSVLVETGFLSNATERAYLASSEGQTYLASGIYRAFAEYKSEMEGH